MKRALVLGGAGLVGSAIARRFVEVGWRVTVIDGFLARTFASESHLEGILDRIELLRFPVESVRDLPERARSADIVIDAMGWTRHTEAERDPLYDLGLNLASHVAFLCAAAAAPPRRIIAIGSRHQFGAQAGVFDDDAPFAPMDIQSVHKCAAEQHFRLFAERTGTEVISLRVGNCFGPGLPVGQGDVGLIGGFVRDILGDRTLLLYEGKRLRNVAYTPDIAALVVALTACPLRGFAGLNYPGHDIEVSDLATALVHAFGKGKIERIPMPPEHTAREIGAGKFQSSLLPQLVPDFTPTPLDAALAATAATILRGAVREKTRQQA